MIRTLCRFPTLSSSLKFMRPLTLVQSLSLSSSPSPSSSTLREEQRDGNRSHVHFKLSQKTKPLSPKQEEECELLAGDHTGRQQNHIWTKEELDEALKTLYRHKPQTFSDYLTNGLMYGAYHTFNFCTGYKHENPSVKSIEWRLLILESIAGVPGFVAAGFRHFRSLRTLNRDHGWIATLLEEAENERMHLLVCLKMFETSSFTRLLVVCAQMFMTPLLMGIYLVHPRSMHRLVGYLEETACHTYASIIHHIETPGTHLHESWKDLPAPPIARGYWKLPDDAQWIDALKCMFADETHHRDVNHTFASMKSDDPNPYVDQHRQDAARAWRLQENIDKAEAVSVTRK